MPKSRKSFNLFSHLLRLNKDMRKRSRRRGRMAFFEALEDRRLLTANFATGPGIVSYSDDIRLEGVSGQIVDINQDGHLDLLGKTIYLGDGSGTNWTIVADGPGGGSVVDIDGDGDLDVLNRQGEWYENLAGDATAWVKHQIQREEDWGGDRGASLYGNVPELTGAQAADFDRDGDLDIIMSFQAAQFY